MKRLPGSVKLIIGMTALLAIVIGILISNTWKLENNLPEIIFFAVLAIIGESLRISLPNEISVSVVFAIFVCIVMLFTPYTAAIIIAAANSFSIHNRDGKKEHIFNIPFYKTLFNASNAFLASLASAFVYNALIIQKDSANLVYVIIPVLIASLVYLAINASLVTLLISNLLGKNFDSIWNQNIKWAAKNFLTMAPLGIILAIAYQNYGYFGILLFFGPLLMARYSFKLYIELKRSYLETIQALSRALEAKDR